MHTPFFTPFHPVSNPNSSILGSVESPFLSILANHLLSWAYHLRCGQLLWSDYVSHSQITSLSVPYVSSRVYPGERSDFTTCWTFCAHCHLLTFAHALSNLCFFSPLWIHSYISALFVYCLLYKVISGLNMKLPLFALGL